tara:strand:+ start:1913 stop:2668 length:756 start_codon:yes stop_codon:yes gene_type:complete
MKAPAMRRLALIPLAFALTGCGLLGGPEDTRYERVQDSQRWEAVRFEDWRQEDPGFRFYPGDTIDVTVHSAPELSRTATVGPDGRINLPLASSIMVAGLSAPEAAGRVADAYVGTLRDPIVEVTPNSFGAQNIIVGGQVAAPGLLEMPSRIGALEAVMMAGGFRDTAARNEVVILRRAPNGGVMMRVVDLRATLRGDGGADPFPLRRHDIVFVPRTTISEVTLFIEQYVYGILPLDQAFSYAIADAITNND